MGITAEKKMVVKSRRTRKVKLPQMAEIAARLMAEEMVGEEEEMHHIPVLRGVTIMEVMTKATSGATCDEMGHYSTQCKASSKKKIEANLKQSDTELALLLTVLEERSYISNALSHQEQEVPLQDSGSPVLGNLRPQQDCVLLIEDNICLELYQANCAPRLQRGILTIEQATI